MVEIHYRWTFCGKIIDIFSSLFFGGQNNFKDSCWGTKWMKDATAIIQKGKLKWKHDHIYLLITLSYCEICYIVSLGSPKEIYAFSHLVMAHLSLLIHTKWTEYNFGKSSFWGIFHGRHRPLFSIGFEIEQQFKFNVKIVNIIYLRKCAYIVVLIAYVTDVNIFKRFFTRSVSFYVPWYCFPIFLLT